MRGVRRALGCGLLAVSLGIGAALKRNLHSPALDNRRAMVLCALAWIGISALGALPMWISLKIGYLDAYFETVSGFTTTGFTMLRGLDNLLEDFLLRPRFASVLLERITDAACRNVAQLVAAKVDILVLGDDTVLGILHEHRLS